MYTAYVAASGMLNITVNSFSHVGTSIMYLIVLLFYFSQPNQQLLSSCCFLHNVYMLLLYFKSQILLLNIPVNSCVHVGPLYFDLDVYMLLSCFVA